MAALCWWPAVGCEGGSPSALNGARGVTLRPTCESQRSQRSQRSQTKSATGNGAHPPPHSPSRRGCIPRQCCSPLRLSRARRVPRLMQTSQGAGSPQSPAGSPLPKGLRQGHPTLAGRASRSRLRAGPLRSLLLSRALPAQGRALPVSASHPPSPSPPPAHYTPGRGFLGACRRREGVLAVVSPAHSPRDRVPHFAGASRQPRDAPRNVLLRFASNAGRARGRNCRFGSCGTFWGQILAGGTSRDRPLGRPSSWVTEGFDGPPLNYPPWRGPPARPPFQVRWRSAAAATRSRTAGPGVHGAARW